MRLCVYLVHFVCVCQACKNSRCVKNLIFLVYLPMFLGASVIVYYHCALQNPFALLHIQSSYIFGTPNVVYGVSGTIDCNGPHTRNDPHIRHDLNTSQRPHLYSYTKTIHSQQYTTHRPHSLVRASYLYLHPQCYP